jgi:hypothetical protein
MPAMSLQDTRDAAPRLLELRHIACCRLVGGKPRACCCPQP